MFENAEHTQRCKHYHIERIRAANFEQRPGSPIYLFFCKNCGRTIAKMILEVETTTGPRLKELRCIVPYEFQPWKVLLDMNDQKREEVVNQRAFGKFETHIHKEIIEAYEKEKAAHDGFQ
jgi:hypothetical protein